MNNEQLKLAVQEYWNKASCGTEVARSPKFSYEYYQEIEEFRYRIEPEILGFADFGSSAGKSLLEVGVGAGTDFVQWIRAGAQAHGVDLTQEAIAHVQHRLKLYKLSAADLRVGDAEHLPYDDNYFDIVYSWGVIHHSPDTVKCLSEIVRVCKPGGTVKVMIYNRHSLFALYKYIRCGLLQKKPFLPWNEILFHNQESIGTKAYTFKETRNMLRIHPVTIQKLYAPATNHDLLYYKPENYRSAAQWAARLWGRNRCGWFMLIELKKNT